MQSVFQRLHRTNNCDLGCLYRGLCPVAWPQPKTIFAWAAKAQSLGYLRIESPAPDAVASLWALMDKYEDLPMDFCDASLVYLAATLKVHRIATVDLRDFTVYRLPGNKRFVHVLDEH